MRRFVAALASLLLAGAFTDTGAQPLLPKHSGVTVIRSELPSPDEKRGLAVPLLFSTILPGTGERFYGASNRSAGFLAAEAVLWISLWWSYTQQERTLSTAASYAVLHGNAAVRSRSDPALLQAMADYRSRGGVASLSSSPELGEDYNQDQLRSGAAVDARWPDSPDYSWDWGNPEAIENSEHWERYQEMIRDYRIYKISFQAVVGGLLLNRLLSAIDVLQLHRSGGKQPTARILPSGAGTGAELSITF